MKKTNRLRFTIGIITTILICAGLFIFLEFSMSRVSSTEAQLQADTYTVGVDYSGIIEKTHIEEGSFVETNDPLFELRSPTLTDAIRNNEVAKSSLLYEIGDDGLIRINAAAPGRVESISYREGAFVPANSQIALVSLKGKFYVSATYKLSSPDYTNISTGTTVFATFPDGNTIRGEVYDIALDVVEKEVVTTARIRFDQTKIDNTVFSIGTPVETTLVLDRVTIFKRLSNYIEALLRPSSDA